MAYVYRLALLIFLALLTSKVFAETIPATSSGASYSCAVSGRSAATASSKDAACQASFNNYQYICPNYYSATGVCQAYTGYSPPTTINYNQVTYCPGPSTCAGGVQPGQVFSTSPTTTTANVTTISEGTYSCPSGYTLSGSDCTRPDVDCSAPYRDLTGQGTTGTGNLPTSVCVAGCSYPVKSGERGCKDGVCTYHTNLGKPSGQCAAGTSDSTAKTPDQLTPQEQCIANGQGYITTNGMTSCVGAGTAGGGSVQVTNPTGGANGTPSSPTFNEDGGVDTNNDGQSDKSKSEYCKDHAQEPQCNGTFYGNCNQGYTCTGDAAQCAIAKKVHERDCQMFITPNLYSQLGDRILAGTDITDSTNPSKLSNRETVSLAGSIQEGSNIGSGQFQDKEIALPTGSVTLPFSKLNWVMQLLGSLLLAGAYLNAARIVGVRGS